MLLYFNQIQRQPAPKYEIIDHQRNTCIGTGDAVAANQVNLRLFDKNYTIELLTDKDKQQKKSDIIKSGTKQGEIEICFCKTKNFLLFSFGYDYRKILLDGEFYTAYEVGLGENMHYWCIFHNDQELCAMIHKADLVKNNCDTYTLYLERDNVCDAVCLLTLFIDCTEHPDIGEVTGYGYDREVLITHQKELISKYDPDFIPRIKARDGLN